MAKARFQRTVIIPADLEERWITYRDGQTTPESFNAFINRLIKQEMDLLCIRDLESKAS